MRRLIVEDALPDRKGHWFEHVETFTRELRALGNQVTVLADRAAEPFLVEQLHVQPVLPASIWHRMGKAAALALSERAMAANPIEKDALTGPRSLEILARVAAQMGEPDRAIAALQRVLSLPYTGLAGIPLTPALLRLDPMFDLLRNDPRFQRLVASHARK